MTKRGQNIRNWVAGDTKLIKITVTDPDNNNDPKNLTGATIRWALSDYPGQTPKITKQTGGSGITIDAPPTDGVFTVTVDSADSEALEGSYWHEAEVVDSSSNRATVTTGWVEVTSKTLSV